MLDQKEAASRMRLHYKLSCISSKSSWKSGSPEDEKNSKFISGCDLYICAPKKQVQEYFGFWALRDGPSKWGKPSLDEVQYSISVCLSI